MARTYRQNGDRDGIRRETHLRRADKYVGWTDDGIWNRDSKRRNKRMVSKHNRRVLNANMDI
jgi:hypothetical protein